MTIAGIIAEYNPFHTGHAYHIRKTREISACDHVIVCMSGSFTQRGEAACLSMRERAKAALMNGADAVFELPTLWSVRTADAFARGGAAILGGLGCDLLSFGTETEDMALIERLADLRAAEPEEVSAAVKSALECGKSHARARGEAIAKYLGIDENILNAPNLILAAEYVRAIRELGHAIKPLPILREGSYHSKEIGKFASAAAIRQGLQNGDERIFDHVPTGEAEDLKGSKMHSMDDMLLYRLRTMRLEDYRALPDAEEGLERRLMKAAHDCTGREDLIEKIKCKRYTYARISRMCAHALLGMTKELLDRYPVPTYARLIGIRRDVMPMLKELNARTTIPLVSETRTVRDSEIFQLDALACDLRGYLREERQPAGALFTEKFLIVD